MTEKAQRELYLELRRCCDSIRESGMETNNSYIFGFIAKALNGLLTALQFRLSQLSLFDFVKDIDNL